MIAKHSDDGCEGGRRRLHHDPARAILDDIGRAARFTTTAGNPDAIASWITWPKVRIRREKQTRRRWRSLRQFIAYQIAREINIGVGEGPSSSSRSAPSPMMVKATPGVCATFPQQVNALFIGQPADENAKQRRRVATVQEAAADRRARVLRAEAIRVYPRPQWRTRR